jgi:hypothetical protein
MGQTTHPQLRVSRATLCAESEVRPTEAEGHHHNYHIRSRCYQRPMPLRPLPCPPHTLSALPCTPSPPSPATPPLPCRPHRKPTHPHPLPHSTSTLSLVQCRGERKHCPPLPPNTHSTCTLQTHTQLAPHPPRPNYLCPVSYEVGHHVPLTGAHCKAEGELPIVCGAIMTEESAPRPRTHISTMLHNENMYRAIMQAAADRDAQLSG